MKAEYNWETILQMGVRMKAANPGLRKSVFYRAIATMLWGSTKQTRLNQIEKAIGKRLKAEWIKLTNGALDRIQTEGQRNMATLVTTMMEKGLMQFEQAYKDLLPTTGPKGEIIPPKVNPSNFEEYMMALRAGRDTAFGAINALKGKEPLELSSDGEVDVEFHPAHTDRNTATKKPKE